MGFRKHPLSRKALVALLEHNGFAEKQSEHKRKGSHVAYVRDQPLDDKPRRVDVDTAIDEFGTGSYSVLWYIVTSQLGFGQGTAAWKRFYAGHPDTAKQHGLTYRKW